MFSNTIFEIQKFLSVRESLKNENIGKPEPANPQKSKSEVGRDEQLRFVLLFSHTSCHFLDETACILYGEDLENKKDYVVSQALLLRSRRNLLLPRVLQILENMPQKRNILPTRLDHENANIRKTTNRTKKKQRPALILQRSQNPQ